MLCRRWSVSFILLPSSLFPRFGVSFAQVLGSMAVGAVVMGFFCVLVHFSPFALIPQVLVHLRSFPGSVLSLVAPFLAVACCMLGVFLFLPCASTSCLQPFQQFA